MSTEDCREFLESDTGIPASAWKQSSKHRSPSGVDILTFTNPDTGDIAQISENKDKTFAVAYHEALSVSVPTLIPTWKSKSGVPLVDIATLMWEYPDVDGTGDLVAEAITAGFSKYLASQYVFVVDMYSQSVCICPLDYWADLGLVCDQRVDLSVLVKGMSIIAPCAYEVTPEMGTTESAVNKFLLSRGFKKSEPFTDFIMAGM